MMKNNYFLNKTIIITGANQGIGLKIAKHFYLKGSNLILCSRNKKKLLSVKKKLVTKFKNKLLLEQLDISKKKQVDKFYKKILNKKIKVDILINNAAILGPKGPTETLNWNEWRKTLEVNLIGSIYMINKIVPHFKKNKYGKILQLSGGGATSSFPFFCPYSVSKTGIVRFIENISIELKDYNIFANSVAPGPVVTNMLKEVVKAGPKKVGVDYYLKTKKIIKKGGTDINKVLNLIEFLAHKNSDMITGKLLSAVWDNLEMFSKNKKRLNNSDFGTLRRITFKGKI